VADEVGGLPEARSWAQWSGAPSSLSRDASLPPESTRAAGTGALGTHFEHHSASEPAVHQRPAHFGTELAAPTRYQVLIAGAPLGSARCRCATCEPLRRASTSASTWALRGRTTLTPTSDGRALPGGRRGPRLDTGLLITSLRSQSVAAAPIADRSVARDWSSST
jgi:hypothetical protein